MWTPDGILIFSLRFIRKLFDKLFIHLEFPLTFSSTNILHSAVACQEHFDNMELSQLINLMQS